MAIRHISSEDRWTAATILGAFLVVFLGSLWYSQRQEWVLVVQVSLALFVLIVFSIVYDRYVIR